MTPRPHDAATVVYLADRHPHAGAPAAYERLQVRHLARPVPVTLPGVRAAFGASEAYLEHLVQTYCRCGFAPDGLWRMCEHARDLDLPPPNRRAE